LKWIPERLGKECHRRLNGFLQGPVLNQRADRNVGIDSQHLTAKQRCQRVIFVPMRINAVPLVPAKNQTLPAAQDALFSEDEGAMIFKICQPADATPALWHERKFR
jgi:hypothetical protein